MQQFKLFPPPAAPPKPVPDDVRNEARELVSNLLVAVIMAGPLNLQLHEEKQEGKSDD